MINVVLNILFRSYHRGWLPHSVALTTYAEGSETVLRYE